jgi:hypothetical protein
MSEELRPDSLPLCKHFQSKGMFIHRTLNPPATADEPGQDDELAGDGYCWCLKSMTSLGPDHLGVSRRLCRPGRVCYEEPLTT